MRKLTEICHYLCGLLYWKVHFLYHICSMFGVIGLKPLHFDMNGVSSKQTKLLDLNKDKTGLIIVFFKKLYMNCKMYLYIVISTVLFCVVLLIYGFKLGYEFQYVFMILLYVWCPSVVMTEVLSISLFEIEIYSHSTETQIQMCILCTPIP
jgi:hypothetical protein